MRIKKAYYLSGFKKSLAKFSPKEKKLIKKKLKLFLENTFDPQLKTHKLKGKFKKYWAFSVTYHLRILFEFLDRQSVGFIDIGSHRIYG